MGERTAAAVKRLGIMQPYLFPHLGYFQLVHACQRFVLLDDVAFIRRGWIHRNRVLLAGEAHLFTVPVRKGSQNRRICDTELVVDAGWLESFRRTLHHAYRQAPHWTNVMSLVDSVLDATHKNVAELATASLRVVADYLGLDVEWGSAGRDHRDADGTGQARIIDICRREGADEYVNAPGGRVLYCPGEFAAHGVRLRFVEGRLPVYDQIGSGFVPGLSIIDVLMFNDRDAVNRMLTEYSLS